MKYNVNFKYFIISEVLKKGIRPVSKEFRVSRNTLRAWIREYKRENIKNFGKVCNYEELIISLKEGDPSITLKEIKDILGNKNEDVSLKKIYGILKRHGLTKNSLFPWGDKNISIEREVGIVKNLLKENRIEDASKIINSLPSLYDFNILKDIPSNYLSLRRRIEQIVALWSNLSLKEIYKKVKKLRIKCEKRKMFLTGMFAALLEMNALNFLGKYKEVYILYKKFKKYLNGVSLSLKYAFLNECFISFHRVPEYWSKNIFKTFLPNFERFCLNLKKRGKVKIQWYYLLSGCFSLKGDIKKALLWSEKILEEPLPLIEKYEYLSLYFSLLSLNGDYFNILKFKKIKSFSPVAELNISLAKAYALLANGKLKESFDIVLKAFYKAKKEHLYSMIIRFTFFMAVYYGAINERKKSLRYLRTCLYFSKKIKRWEQIYFSILKFKPTNYKKYLDLRIKLWNLYFSACKTLKKREYIKAFKFARKNGLEGFLHHLILLHPQPVINLIQKGEDTFLPPKFLTLPVFERKKPLFELFLLRKKELLIYGKRKIFLSDSKFFHLLIYLFLNRKRFINKEELINIFLKNSRNPEKSLIKLLTKIRKMLGISKKTLFSKKNEIFFDVDAKIDLEEFENKFKLGKIFERAGEIRKALREYKEAFYIYKKSPFEKMSYYYHFAEDIRSNFKIMYKEIYNFIFCLEKKK